MKDQIPATASVDTGVDQAVSTVLTPVESQEKRYRVFLAWTTADVADRRETLSVMLQKAGMEVFPLEEQPATEEAFRKQAEACIAQADCSIHLLGGDYAPVLSADPSTSYAKWQYEQARAKSQKTQGGFKRFVWNLPLDGLILQGEQQDFVVQVQNSLTSEVLFTSVSNPAQFIDDMRAFLERDVTVKQVPKDFDLAFISNVQDAADCYQVIEALEKQLKVTTLTVVPENDVDYRALAADQVRRSKLTVVYFKDASDWAVSFVKQLWKHVGGASSSTPFLLIGEDEPRRNRFLRFRAPMTLLEVVPKSMVQKTVQEVFAKLAKGGKLTEDTFSPYTGLRPFNEDESIFFKGREKHIDYIIDLLARQKFTMVTGSSGDGKSSLLYAGVIPNLKGGFLRTQFTKWAVADFRPERQPLRNMASAIASELRIKNPDDVENALSYGFSALVDLYKKSPIYCDMTSQEWIEGDEESRKTLKRKAANLLILVDQFEEFFTNIENYRDGVASPISQIAVNVLVETVRIAREENLPIYVVCTMRSDYIGQCVAFRGFAEMIGLSTYYVPRLKREEVQEVIQGPAALNGNNTSLRLTQRLLNDLGDGIDQLPVLQHALHQIWTDSDRGQQEMDLLNYAKVGGLGDSKLPKEDQPPYEEWFRQLPAAKQDLYEKPRLRNVLNRHANELYLNTHEYYNQRWPQQKISAETAQGIVRTVFTCLTKIDETRAVRNRMTLQQITDIHGVEGVDPPMVNRVINIYREPGNTFVQPFITEEPESVELPASTTLDITHESFIRNWERLTDWAEEEHKSADKLKELKVEVNRWILNDCDKKYLLGPGQYGYFNEWYKKQKPNAAWIRRYLRPDELVSELEPMEQAQMYLEDIQDFLADSRRQIARRRRWRNFALGFIAFLMLLAIAGFIRATINEQRAIAQEKIAQANAAEAKASAARAEVARLQALQNELRANRATILAKVEALKAQNEKAIALGERLNAEQQTKFAERQRQIAELERQAAEVAKQDAIVQAQIAREQKELAEAATEEATLQNERAVVERDNALLTQSLFLASMAEQQSSLGKTEVGVLLALKALPDTIGAPGRRPYVEEAEAALYYSVNKIVNARPKLEFAGHTNRLVTNVFTPDGQRLVSTSWDKTARVWDTRTGAELERLTQHTNIVRKAYISASGKLVATMGDEYTARVFDITDGNTISVLRGHADLLTHISISPDEQRVLTSSTDGTARLYRINRSEDIATLSGHTGPVVYASFSPDGKRIVTASEDGSAKLWNGETGVAIASMGGHGGPVRFADFSADGSQIVTTSDDGTARLWDGQSGGQLTVLKGHAGKVFMGMFTKDGNRIATASADSTARIWDARTGKELAILKGHQDAVYNVQFASDGLHLLTSSEDSTARLWDGVSYLRLGVFTGNPRYGYYATFSPDGKQMAVAARKDKFYSIRIYDVLPNRQALIDMARSRTTRSLTQAELKEFFLNDKRLRSVNVDSLMRERKARRQRAGEAVTSLEPLFKPTSSAGAPTGTAGTATTAGSYHVVQIGETLWSIGKKYSVSPERIRQLNKLSSNALKRGQRLQIR